MSVSQIQSADLFVTIDLKDAYFHKEILPQHRKFLRFAFRGEAYQYRVLPFSLALSPRTYTKCMDAALAALRLQLIRILNYIDDWLILAQTLPLGWSKLFCILILDHESGRFLKSSALRHSRRLVMPERALAIQRLAASFATGASRPLK